jgi:hypothetical protein
MSVDNPQKDVIDPALKGGKNISERSNQTSSVKRVVLTISIAVARVDCLEAYNAPDHVLNEDYWNKRATLDYYPYGLSKTVAKQTAWVIAGSQTNWSMVALIQLMLWDRVSSTTSRRKATAAIGNQGVAQWPAEFPVGPGTL